MPSQSPPDNENRNPYADLIGIKFTDAEMGSSFCTVEVREDLLNPNRVLHGGVSYALADTGMAYALFASLDENLTCATITIKLTYLRPVYSGTLSCKSWVVSKTRSLVFMEAEVFNDDRLVAKASATFSILRTNADRSKIEKENG